MRWKTESYGGILADRVRILYFLEDRAQEGFVTALVERLAREMSIPAKMLIHDVRNANRGSSVINEFKNFLKDTVHYPPYSHLVVVAIDGNCKGYGERKKQLEKHIKPGHPFEDKIVFAIPDPHIERWYILDQKAFKDGVGIDQSPPLPKYKCEKNYYKQLLIRTLKEADINSLLGVAQYAERIVKNIENLNLLERSDDAFKFFVRELRRMLKM